MYLRLFACPRVKKYNFHSTLIKTRIIENWLPSKALDKLIVLFEKENIYFCTDFLAAQTETDFSGCFVVQALIRYRQPSQRSLFSVNLRQTSEKYPSLSPNQKLARVLRKMSRASVTKSRAQEILGSGPFQSFLWLQILLVMRPRMLIPALSIIVTYFIPKFSFVTVFFSLIFSLSALGRFVGANRNIRKFCLK